LELNWIIHGDDFFTWWFVCDRRSERGAEAPRDTRPRPIQISCSTVFYGENETKFRRSLRNPSPATRPNGVRPNCTSNILNFVIALNGLSANEHAPAISLETWKQIEAAGKRSAAQESIPPFQNWQSERELGRMLLWRTTFIDLQFAVVLLPETQA